MALIQPVDHSGFVMLEGYITESLVTGTDAEGKPWSTIYISTSPIKGTTSGELLYSGMYTASITLISESNGAVGGYTGSLIDMKNYSYFSMEFSRFLNMSCSISATLMLNPVNPIDYVPITDQFGYGGTITSSLTMPVIIERDTPVRYAYILVNHSKSIATNSGIVTYSLYN